MSNQTLGIIIGGAIPALFFALFNVFQKFSVRHETSGFYFMLMVGITITIACSVVIFFSGDRAFTWQGALFGIGSGLCWTTGIGLISYTLHKYNTPLAKLAPIYNANTLLVVIISLIIFSEWQEVNLTKTIAATLMIVGGSVLLSNS